MSIILQVPYPTTPLSRYAPTMRIQDFTKKRRSFRFEAVWMKEEQCGGVIKNAWEGQGMGSPMQNFIHKMDRCCVQLQTWSRMSFGNMCRLLGQKKKSLAQAEAISMKCSNHEQVRILRGEVYDLMVKEECLWHQRSRVNWLQSGDLNTSDFHS